MVTEDRVARGTDSGVHGTPRVVVARGHDCADIGQAWEVVKAEGAYITNKKTGAVQVHPASKTLNELRRDYIKVLTALGTRATPAPPPDSGPSLDDILDG